MPNTKKAEFDTWVEETVTLRDSLNKADDNEMSLYQFLRQIEKELPRVQSDRDAG